MINSTKSKHYDYSIVNLRALAIILIVFGHSIIIYDTTFQLLQSNVSVPFLESLKHITSFIQLKLFFSISGFLLYFTMQRGKGFDFSQYFNFIVKKSKRLMLPALMVCVFWMDPIKISLHVKDYVLDMKFITSQIEMVNIGHLWYLPCLFIIFVTVFPLLKSGGGKILTLCVLFSISLIVSYKHAWIPEIFQLQNAAYYVPFFLFGFIWSAFKDKLFHYSLSSSNSISKGMIVATLLVILISFGFVIYNVSSIGFSYFLSFCILSLLYYFMLKRTNLVIEKISENSYGLYLFHSPMIYITAVLCPNINPWLMVFVNFIVFGSIAYTMTELLSKSKLKFIVGK